VAAVISVGADGFPGGWVAVELRDGAFERAWVSSTVEALLAGVADGAFVGVDMPVGLVDAGWRTADLRARGLVGGRHNTVFRIPPRAVWQAADLTEANQICREMTGSGVSAHTWSLRSKILQVDAFGGRLFEVHPELVFASMAGRPLAHGKRTWNGQAARRALLARAGVVLPDDLGRAGTVPVDDVLDAAVVAWCAHRIGLGDARQVPDPPAEHDRLTGRPIVIWYAGGP
jgi:predicted RNase H-like nuclease